MNNMGMMNMNNMNNNEAYWKSLTSDNKKILLNNLLSMNNIYIPIKDTEWNCNHLNNFINNATYDDVSKLPSFIMALVGKTLDNDFPDRDVLRYQNGNLCFWNNKNQRAQGLMPLLGTLRMSALNNPQIFDTIPNKQQYLHLIETLKSVSHIK